MTRYNFFVMWADGSWSVFSAECEDVYKYVYQFRMKHIGQIFQIFHEEWGL